MIRSKRWDVLFPSSISETGLVPKRQVSVVFKGSFSTLSVPGLRKRLGKVWEDALERARCEGSTFLVDQPKFRLAGVDASRGSVCLHIGLTTYKEYIAFRSSPALVRWAKSQAQLRGVALGRVLPNVLGNIALTVTRDRLCMAFIRSKHVSTYRGYLDFAGGHPEPSSCAPIGGGETCDDPKLSNRIRDELFRSVVEELREDLGFRVPLIGEPKLLGILTNKRDLMKPDMVFLVNVGLGRDEILDGFQSVPQLPKEVSRIVFLDPFDPRAKLANFRMTPIAEGALVLAQSAKEKLSGVS